MKKILFITPFAPSNIGAAMKFTKKVIETLAESYKIDLVYFMSDDETEYNISHKNVTVLKIYHVGTKERIAGILQHPFLFPIFSVRYRRELVRSILEWNSANKYDLLFLDHSQTFIYGKELPNAPKILMSHDVIFQRVSRVAGKMLSSWCHFSEKRMVKQPLASVFSFSTKDRDIIKEEYGVNSYVTCGNIDDLVYDATPSEIKNNFVFFGQWVRKDNAGGLEWFMKEVYPYMDDDMTIKIIGRGLSKELISLVEQSDRVEYLGFIENPYQLIANSTAVLSPLFSGAGVKFKVLESLACGTPVIGNEIAFEGIPKDFSEFMIYADNSRSYINAMKSISFSYADRKAMKNRFLKEYVNPYIIEHISGILK